MLFYNLIKMKRNSKKYEENTTLGGDGVGDLDSRLKNSLGLASKIPGNESVLHT